MQKLADSNVWLALTLSKHVFHKAVLAWFDDLGPEDSIVFCRSTQQSYLRLLTTAQVLAPYGVLALSNSQAWTVYEKWLDIEGIAFAAEPSGVENKWKSLAARATASPKLWMDAYLAAFAISGGYQLVTTDKAFKQFNGLNVQLLAL